MNTLQVKKECEKCSESFNCKAYMALNFTQMQGCQECQENSNSDIPKPTFDELDDDELDDMNYEVHG